MHPSATDTLLGQAQVFVTGNLFFLLFIVEKRIISRNSRANNRGLVDSRGSTPGPAVGKKPRGKKLLAIKLGGRLDRTAFHTPLARLAHTVFRSTLLTISPQWTNSG
jgi:hypothetical protein